MKRIIVLFLLFSLSLSLFATETIWLWDHNDDRVTSFRYSTSYDEEWRVVPGDHYSVKVDSRDIYDYIFFLQQSYDGKTWSNSSVSIHRREVTEEEKDTMVYGKYSEEGLSSIEIVSLVELMERDILTIEDGTPTIKAHTEAELATIDFPLKCVLSNIDYPGSTVEYHWSVDGVTYPERTGEEENFNFTSFGVFTIVVQPIVGIP